MSNQRASRWRCHLLLAASVFALCSAVPLYGSGAPAILQQYATGNVDEPLADSPSKQWKIDARRKQERIKTTIVRQKDLPAQHLIPSNAGHPNFDASNIQRMPGAPLHAVHGLHVAFDGVYLQGKVKSTFRKTLHEPLVHLKAEVWKGNQMIPGGGITSKGVPYEDHHIFLAPGTAVRSRYRTETFDAYYRSPDASIARAKTFAPWFRDVSVTDESIGKGSPPLHPTRPSTRLYEDLTNTPASGRMLPASHDAQAAIPSAETREINVSARPISEKDYIDVIGASVKHYAQKYHPQTTKVTAGAQIVKGLNSRPDEPVPHFEAVLYKQAGGKKHNTYTKIAGGGFSSTGIAYKGHKIYQKPGTKFLRNWRIIDPTDPGPKAHVHASRTDLDHIYPDTAMAMRDAGQHYRAKPMGNVRPPQGNNLNGPRVQISWDPNQRAKHDKTRTRLAVAAHVVADDEAPTHRITSMARPIASPRFYLSEAGVPERHRSAIKRPKRQTRRIRIEPARVLGAQEADGEHATSTHPLVAGALSGSGVTQAEQTPGSPSAAFATRVLESPAGAARTATDQTHHHTGAHAHTSRWSEVRSFDSGRDAVASDSAPTVDSAAHAAASSPDTAQTQGEQAQALHTQAGHAREHSNTNDQRLDSVSPGREGQAAAIGAQSESEQDWLHRYAASPPLSPPHSDAWNSAERHHASDFWHHSPEWAWPALPLPAAGLDVEPAQLQDHLAAQEQQHAMDVHDEHDWIQHLLRTPPRIHLP
ncbi:hypothetical protein CBOM_00524 [Ceraceosorus bombacis]|uniref:Uncharacterized protein n=1 Tax=Ceraceosorus bombacis TaxID=401625 RepID=A0A0P1BAT0_9BASI|nr:hypothetical protein CBOM_00524 [Ceraceosorus bombacis]